ncbi:MAG: hypothetical protein JKY23_04365 [Nitrospinaceae bacterium]|nr:hypothetical protein [Nitrospinaceae bacterium]
MEDRPEVLDYYVGIAIKCIRKEYPSVVGEFVAVLRGNAGDTNVNRKLYTLMSAVTSTNGFYNYVRTYSSNDWAQTSVALKLLETSFRQWFEGLDVNHRVAQTPRDVHFKHLDEFVHDHRVRVITGQLTGHVWQPPNKKAVAAAVVEAPASASDSASL